MAVDHVVKVRRPEGQWVTLGTEEARGVVPEGLAMAADLQGPSSCSFTMKRPADVVWSELQAANQVQVDVAGVPVWGGRINQTPAAGKGVGEQISVSAQGWVNHLGDDQQTWNWVTQRLSGFTDTRGMVAADLTKNTMPGTVTSEGGSLVIGYAQGAQIVNDKTVSAVIDLGPGCSATQVGMDISVVGPNADYTFYIMGSDSPWWNDGSRVDYYSQFTSAWTLGVSYTVGGAQAARRYVTALIAYTGAGGTVGQDRFVKIKGFRAARGTTLTAGTFQPTTTASGAITDVVTQWGCTPLLTSPQITPTSFVVPELHPDGYRTPREIIEAVNAYHDYLWGVDALRRPYWRPRPTDPVYEVGSFSGGQFDDTSLGNLDRIYNRVIVEYTGPDGVAATVSRTNASTILTRQGFTRTYRLSVSAILTPTAAAQIGDVWLSKHADAPLAGSITVAPGDIRTTQGVPVHPSILLTKTGERLRLTGQIDPVTGAVGRVGTIVSVSYNPAAETAQLQLDNDTQSMETWLARLAVIQGSGR